MRSAAARAGRTVEARLASFDWSPMRVQRAPARGGPVDPARLALAGAAGAVIESAPKDESPRARHDAGVAFLLIDRESDAADMLQDAAQREPNDAQTWSDLAAARYTLAVRENRPYELPLALAATERALRISPANPDALFNRALMIERLGIEEAARRAWHRYLKEDGSSPWATEALQHLGRLGVADTRAEFDDALRHAIAALRGGDAAPIAALTRAHPEEARRWSEVLLLANWANAITTGDRARAKESLDAVRAIARSLMATNGEALLADAVAAIDGASPDRLRLLAAAHSTYYDARILYRDRRAADALPRFHDAAVSFDAARSPMAEVARFYAACAVYDDNRTAEARTMLEGIRQRIDRQRQRALWAHVEWELSLCHINTGAWPDAIHAADDAARTFDSLGETLNRALVQQLIASVLDVLAQPRSAWRVRVEAFPVLSRAGATERIRTYLTDAIRSEIARGEVDSALALSAIAIDELRRDRDPHALAIAQANRARLVFLTGDVAAAGRSIREARNDQKIIPDAALRARAGTYVDIAEATVARSRDPQRALALLNTTLAFVAVRGEHRQLPEVYLERGRTFVRAGNDDAALADFRTGIAELNELRSQFDDRQLRSSFYDTAPELFAECAALLLRRGDAGGAFALTDRARARTLQEQLGMRSDTDPVTLEKVRRAIPPDAALLEYALLGDRLAIFHASSKSTGVVVVPVDEAALRSSVDRFRDLLQRRADVPAIRLEAARLYTALIAPVAREIAPARRLIIVPDRELHAVPFPALANPASQRYLIEEHEITIAPSAAFAVNGHLASSLTPALIVGDPAVAGAPALPEAAREAAAIASMYEPATLLTGERATASRFAAAAEASGMIHYAGHAESESGSAVGLLRFAPEAGGTGQLDVSDIGRLSLRRSPIVVLAACGTIRGEAGHVEGMRSAAHAFLGAGARSVVGTLWEIDDGAAAALFDRFHRQLRAGSAPATALASAQRELIRQGNGPLSHPSGWAPVEILGNSD